MLLVVCRLPERSDTVQTVGQLFVDGQFFAPTIEPPATPNPQHPKGCIPLGWYRVAVTKSPKFGRLLPLLCQVPNFSGIRIHAGRSVANTSGCICVGTRSTETHLTETLLQAQNNGEEIFVCITNPSRMAVELCNPPKLNRSEHRAQPSLANS